LYNLIRLASTESKLLFTLLHEGQKPDPSTEALGFGLKFNLWKNGGVAEDISTWLGFKSHPPHQSPEQRYMHIWKLRSNRMVCL